jgi:polo-like kinase 1
MLQMLEGVRYLHHSKVIHRDLKLGNLFLGRGDEIKIGDFGLACKLQFDGERKRTLCGTPNYIAPEVLEGKNGHSYEVDLWSIGVVMYTCLVGKPPFETSDVKSTYKLIKSNTYSFPDRLHISQGAKALIRRILQSDPESRPSIDNVLQDPWFLGEGMALLQKIKPAAATGLSSTTSISSANVHRQPLHPIQDPQVKRGASSSSSGLDWEMPATNKYPDHFSVSSRTAAASADMPGPALERNLTITSAASHYLPDRLDSARGASSALQSVNNIMRPTSASAALSSDKALPPSLSSFGTASSYSSQDYFSSGFRAAASSSTSAHANNINKPCKTDRPLSAISSNAVNTTPTKRLSKQLETLDLQRDTALESCVARGAESKGEGEGAGMASTTGAGRVGDGEDQLALQSMHKNIRAVLAHAPQPSTATATKKDPPTSYLPLPSVWVSRWVDYSKKYGLGYKLSNGCSGVFFNDATKMLLETDGDSLEYIERMRRDDATKYDVRRPQSLKDHPPDLTKKVTLMEHFKNYLDETHPSRHAGDSPLDQMAPLSTASEEAGVGGVYVRKWMRTRHSIIFRLSNNNFQVTCLHPRACVSVSLIACSLCMQ